jgi:hypothetical protein
LRHLQSRAVSSKVASRSAAPLLATKPHQRTATYAASSRDSEALPRLDRLEHRQRNVTVADVHGGDVAPTAARADPSVRPMGRTDAQERQLDIQLLATGATYKRTPLRLSVNPRTISRWMS